MFNPSIYEAKLLKEQEMRDRLKQAAVDRLARELRPQRTSLFRRAGEGIRRRLLHSDDQRPVVGQTKPTFVRQSNAIQ